MMVVVWCTAAARRREGGEIFEVGRFTFACCPDCSLVAGLRMLQAYDREPLSGHQLCFKISSALCYPTNDSDNFSKLQPKADIGIFVGYAPAKKAFRIYNKRTHMIIETIHVEFDELAAMASE
ncbi:hypothetical protein Tco_0528189 [Tanacetum coccineum]